MYDWVIKYCTTGLFYTYCAAFLSPKSTALLCTYYTALFCIHCIAQVSTNSTTFCLHTLLYCCKHTLLDSCLLYCSVVYILYCTFVYILYCTFVYILQWKAHHSCLHTLQCCTCFWNVLLLKPVPLAGVCCKTTACSLLIAG